MQITVVLGDEFDDALRAKLMDILQKIGATPIHGADRTIAGSQEIESLEVALDGERLLVEAETYVGLSITGPSNLVQKVETLMKR